MQDALIIAAVLVLAIGIAAIVISLAGGVGMWGPAIGALYLSYFCLVRALFRDPSP